MDDLINRLLHLNLRIKHLELGCAEQDLEQVKSIAQDFDEFWVADEDQQEYLGKEFADVLDEHFWELILK